MAPRGQKAAMLIRTLGGVALSVTAVAYISRFVGGWAAVVGSRGRRRLRQLPPMHGKVVLVTGGNRGIGLQTAEALAGDGATVVLACRSMEKGLAAKNSLTAEAAARVEVLGLDLASVASVLAFAHAFRAKFQQLHVLILNAGLARTFLGSNGFTLTADGLEEMVGVNFLGHFLLTGLLLPVLRGTPGARVIGLTSVAMANSYACGIDIQSWTSRRPDFQDWKQYGESKLAARLFMQELQHREPQLLCISCHPGVAAGTGLMHQEERGSVVEGLYSLFVFRALAMRPEYSHLNTIYLATAAPEELEPGACYQPIGRKLSWTANWLQRVGALQAPVSMETQHHGLWAAAEKLLNERAAAVNGGVPVLPVAM